MKKYVVVMFMLIVSGLRAQENLGYLLASGVEDTRRFASSYVVPGVEALVYNRTGGWFHTAEAKAFLGFEFSVVGNASVNFEQYQTFTLATSEYQNLAFPDGALSRNVSSILGPSGASSPVTLYYDTPAGTGQARFVLPGGISETGISVIPTVFLQARLGIFRGTEIKARYFPTTDYGNVNVDLLGGAIKHEFTSWLPAPELFPLTISGMVTYSAMDANYSFSDLELLEGDNQRLESHMDFWMFSALVSTNFPTWNLYGGVSYLEATSETDMLGTFVVINGDTGESIASLSDPLSVTHEFSGIKANLGATFTIGLFTLHAEYNFQKYQTISAGLHIGI